MISKILAQGSNVLDMVGDLTFSLGREIGVAISLIYGISNYEILAYLKSMGKQLQVQTRRCGSEGHHKPEYTSTWSKTGWPLYQHELLNEAGPMNQNDSDQSENSSIRKIKSRCLAQSR